MKKKEYHRKIQLKRYHTITRKEYEKKKEKKKEVVDV